MSDVATALLQLTGRTEPAADPALAAVRLARASIDALILRLGQTIDAKVTAQLAGGLTQLTAGGENFVLKLEAPLPVNTAVALRIAVAADGQPAVTVTVQPQPIAAQPAPPPPLPTQALPQPVAAPHYPALTPPPAAAQPAVVPASPTASPLAPAALATLPQTVGQASPALAAPPQQPPAPQIGAPPIAASQVAATQVAPPLVQPAGVQPIAPQPPAPVVVATTPAPSQSPIPVTATPLIGPSATPVPIAVPPNVAPAVPAAAAQPLPATLATPAAPVAPPAQPAAANLSAPTPAPPPASAPALTPPPPVPTATPAPAAIPARPAPPTTAAAPASSILRPATTPSTSPPLAQILADPVQAAARQDSVLPLLARLATLTGPASAAFPRPALEAIARVLAARLDLNRAPPDGKSIRDAVLRAGVITEPGARAPADAKSALLQLRSALSGFLGGEVEAIAPVTRRPPPPLNGEPVRAPSPQQAGPSLEEPVDTARQLLGHTDAALARLKLLQLASNPPDAARPNVPAPAAEFRVEVPMQLGAETGILQLLIERDGRHKRTPLERGWRMRFALNFTATGEVGAEIALLGRSANVALWAVEPATVDALEAMLPELAPALARHGLDVGNVRVRRGAPPPTGRAPGQLLDSAR